MTEGEGEGTGSNGNGAPPCHWVRVALQQQQGPPLHHYLPVLTFGEAARRMSCKLGQILRFEHVDGPAVLDHYHEED